MSRSVRPDSRRRMILETLEDEGCSHTSEVAYIVALPKSTVRRDLDRMEDEGLVRGVKHDERDLLRGEGGRIRIYWNITDGGLEVLGALEDAA